MSTRLRVILSVILALAVAFWLGEHVDEWRRPRPLEAGTLRYTKAGLEYEVVNPGATKYTAKSIAFYVNHVADGQPPKHDYEPKGAKQVPVFQAERQADRGWVRYTRELNTKFAAHSSTFLEFSVDDKALYGGKFVCGWLVVTYSNGTNDYELQLAPMRGGSLFYLWVAG